MSEPPRPAVEVVGLDAWFGPTQVLRRVDLPIARNVVTAIIGPSGAGKSTLLRCLNRMHELSAGARVAGRVLLDGADVYQTDPMVVRRRVGLVSREPTLFPAMTLRENVLAGRTMRGVLTEQDESCERAMRRAGVWDDLRDMLDASPRQLPRGLAQRLCIARALCVEPEVLLLDEPCSQLDPVATSKIEEVLDDLRDGTTVVLVTDNVQQAARASDVTAHLHQGELIEFGRTDQLFTNPSDIRTENFLTGRFG